MNQNQVNGITSQGQRNIEIDMRGVCGELAVCKKYNAYPDFVIGPHYSGFDLVVNGTKIDVKTTKYAQPYLQSKVKKKAIDCDVFVLVHDQQPNYTLIGWMLSDNLLQDENIRDTGFGNHYTMTAEELWPMRTFQNYLTDPNYSKFDLIVN